MPIKNYTSSIPVSNTIYRIEQLLVQAGATGIAKEYEGGKIKCIVFNLPYEDGKLPVTIKLPANVNRCREIFWKEYCETRRRGNKTDLDFQDQAERTSWKLQQDWVEVQLALIKMNQQTKIQAFMAYAYDGHQTFYERIEAGKFKALLPLETH
jgi:hypothetical protein